MLPSELVSAIFEHSRYPRTPDGFRSRLRFPMVLLQVCHRWRVIAIETPTLWTHIIVLPTDKYHQPHLDDVHLYVERSGSRPISLTWNHRDWNHNPVIHDVLPSTFTRLKNVIIATAGSGVRDSLQFNLEAMSFPILERLTCYTGHETSVPAVNLHAPRLRHGVFHDYMIPVGTFPSMVTLEIILSGTIQWFDAAAFFDLLHKVAQTLKCLRLRTPRRALQNYTRSTPNVQLPELVVLDLRFTPEMLSFISTPNLRTLCLEDYSGDSISRFTSFDAPMLTHLKLENLHLLDLETTPDFPWRFQELEAVMLLRCRSSRSFFCHASSTRHGIPAFPSLRSITFTDTNVFPSIKHMVEGREAADPGRSTLKRLRFVAGNHYLWVDDMEWASAQGIEFSHGPGIGDSWATTPF